MTDTRLENFLDLARDGWLLFPLNGDKIPAIKGWEQAATDDETTIRNWYDDPLGDGCNFGVAVGRMGLVVIDCDVAKKRKLPDGTEAVVSGEDSLAVFLKEHRADLPPTLRVKTPSGGFHLYYRAEGLRGKNNFLPAVDIKTNGGFVVAPGSITAKGAYTPDEGFRQTRLRAVADLPDWFRTAYNRPLEPKEKPSLNYSIYVVPDTREKVEEAVRRFQEHEEVPEGMRNTTLFGFMRDLCKLGITLPRAKELYDMYGIPVFGLDPEEAEVRKTIESAYRDMSVFGCESEEGRRAAVLHLFTPIGEDGEPSEEDEDEKNGGIDLVDLVREEPEPRQWFIQNWLPAEPGSSVLYSGRGGTGKSATIIDLMLALATGADWFGLKVTHPAKTYFVTCEDSKEEVNRRLRLGRRKELYDRVPRGTMRVWSRLGKDSLLCSTDKNGNMKRGNFAIKLKKFAKEMFDGTGGVLILDTASDIYGGNENDRSAVSRFVKQILADIALDAGCTIIVLAHPAKSGDGYSGSTAWEAAFRGRWELNYRDRVKNKKGVERDKLDGPLVLSNEKANYTTAGNHVTLRNMGGYFEVVPEMTEAELAEWEEGRKGSVYRRIRERAEAKAYCGFTQYSLRPIGNEAIDDMSEDEILDAVRQLTAEGRVEEIVIGKRKCLVPTGYNAREKRYN